jgi:hypothetical protein
VVYDLRNQPDLQETPQDILAVFHFHIHDVTQSGVPRINMFHVFHAQTTYLTLFGDYRAVGYNATVNQRTRILVCPYPPGSTTQLAWEPGLLPPTPTTGGRRIANFGIELVRSGALAPEVFMTTGLQQFRYGHYQNGGWVWENYNSRRGYTFESNNFGSGGPGSLPANNMSAAEGWPQ